MNELEDLIKSRKYILLILLLILGILIATLLLVNHKPATTNTKISDSSSNSSNQVTAPSTNTERSGTTPYISSSDHFQIDFPGTPQVQNNTANNAYIWTSPDKQSSYTVVVINNYPAANNVASFIAQDLTNSLNSFVNNFNGQLESSSLGTWGTDNNINDDIFGYFVGNSPVGITDNYLYIIDANSDQQFTIETSGVSRQTFNSFANSFEQIN